VVKRKNERNETMKVMIGFLAGFAAGAAVALLFAPKAGEEIRAELSTAAHTDWDAANTQLHKGMTSMQQQMSSMQEQLQTMRTQSDAVEEVEVEEVDVAVEA
jgi:gas vesicle protein